MHSVKNHLFGLAIRTNIATFAHEIVKDGSYQSNPTTAVLTQQPPMRMSKSNISPLFTIAFVLLLFCIIPQGHAQTALPSANPVMTYTDEDGQEVEDEQYDGSAPLHATFKARPQDLGQYTPLYEWRFIRANESTPFLIRYDEDTEYDFTQSGTFSVELLVSFVAGSDTIQYAMDTPFSITITESKLEVPNAFTPNGDGVNDVFRVKEGYQSIISFKAMVFSRWGKKLFEWSDPADGWDGRSGGKDVPDGAYYLHIEAQGADGHKYHIKKVINLLRGYTESGAASN